jgi:transposase, IS5 family
MRVFSLHAPEVECIGPFGSGGKAHKRYEFGVKASVATTLKRSKGGQLIVHAKTLPRKPYDGHTLGVVIRSLRGWPARPSIASSPIAAIAATTRR